MYWFIDTNTQITYQKVISGTMYTEKYKHVWKWNNANYGGVSLIPKRGSEHTVWQNKVVCKNNLTDCLKSTRII